MSKKERNIRRTMFFAVVAVVVLLLCGSFKTVQSEPQVVSYFVEQGDTLWSIAREYKPNDMSYDKYIYKVLRHNGISATIKYGQAIEILIWEGK